jgi:hypothetical protein
MFLEFSTAGGPLFVNADNISAYQRHGGQEATVLRMSDGGILAVLEHPYMITKALETHTCVVRVLDVPNLQRVPQQKPLDIGQLTVEEEVAEGGGGVRVTARDGDGYVLGQWETNDRGHQPIG